MKMLRFTQIYDLEDSTEDFPGAVRMKAVKRLATFKGKSRVYTVIYCTGLETNVLRVVETVGDLLDQIDAAHADEQQERAAAWDKIAQRLLKT